MDSFFFVAGNQEDKGPSRIPQQDHAPLPICEAPVQNRLLERAEARLSVSLQTLPASLQPTHGGKPVFVPFKDGGFFVLVCPVVSPIYGYIPITDLPFRS